ncbi:MAG: DUF3419 family protein [Jiangellales bacterium]
MLVGVRRPAPFGFGLSQEDEHIESVALGMPGGSVLSVTSAGDMALSLRALGAERVTGVDIEPSQNHLARLKQAAVLTLDPLDAAGLLGYRRADPGRRSVWFEEVRPFLPPGSQMWWGQHLQLVLSGAVWAGRFESFVRRVVRALRPLLEPRFRALLEAPDLASQREVFNRRLDLPPVRGLFRVAFTPRVFARRGMDPRSLQFHDPTRSLGAEYFARFRDMCTSSPARANPYLQLFTMGEVVYPEALPAFLTPQGATALRSDPGAVRFVDADITRHLATEPKGTYNRFHLSNVTDWLPADAFDELLTTIAGRSARPARLVWRAIHVDRGIPDTLTGTITTNREWGKQLRAHDRFPIYAIIPATVE